MSFHPSFAFIPRPPPQFQQSLRPQTSPAKRKKPKTWTAEEDQKLKDLVALLGENDWGEVSNRLGTRSPRQCRERFRNYLAPNIKNEPWTEEEDRLLEEKYQELGGKWQTLASFFANRSTNNVKNRFVMLQRHKNGRKPRKSQKPKAPEPVREAPVPQRVKPAPSVDIIDGLADSLSMDWFTDFNEQTLWDW